MSLERANDPIRHSSCCTTVLSPVKYTYSRPRQQTHRSARIDSSSILAAEFRYPQPHRARDRVKEPLIPRSKSACEVVQASFFEGEDAALSCALVRMGAMRRIKISKSQRRACRGGKSTILQGVIVH